MGCTSSKENANPPSTKHTDDHQQIINDQFRQWLKTHRSEADELVLNAIRSSDADIDTCRPIVAKALDLVIEREDVKTSSKLTKLLQKELNGVSTKKVSSTVEILKQTAEKFHDGKLALNTGNNERSIDGKVTTTDPNKSGLNSSGDPGIALKEALETARILFYKGKQAAIFANPNGGYDVKILDETDDVLKEDGNLLRSIIVTEVKMRPKPIHATHREKLVNENEIGDDFRRSIDAALKGLESVYHGNSKSNSENGNVRDVDGATSFAPPYSSSSLNRSIDSVPLSSTTINDQRSSPVQQRSISNINEQQENSLPDRSSPPVDTLNQTNTTPNASTHHVTYTEIIRSESRDGEQTRRIKSESYDEPTQPLSTMKITTKSEFSADPTSGEKIMEQSVQVISVKVRNEMTTNNV